MMVFIQTVRSIRSLPFLLVALYFSGCAGPITEKKLNIELPERRPLENYKLVPGDEVGVVVFQEPDWAIPQQRIAQDGTINMASVGLIRIAGLSTDEASRAIAEALKKGYLVDPQVTVNIVTYSPRRFTVIGQVKAPGTYEMPTEEYLTLPEAVAVSGGNTPIGNLHKVLISRRKDGTLYEYKVNMLNPKGRLFLVEEGDVITVPESLF